MSSNEKKSVSEKTESEMLRRFKQNPFIFVGTFIVLVIVIVAFVFVPAIAPEQGYNRVELTFGYYGRVPIRAVPGNFFWQMYEANYTNWSTQQAVSGNLSRPNNNQNASIWRGAFDAAVVRTAMLQEMKRAGYAIPDRIVDREVARLPMFQENGRFSQALFRQMDESRRMALWSQTKEDIIATRFYSAITGLLIPEAETEFFGRMGSPERSFDMAVFPVDAYPDEEIEAFVKENPDTFRTAHLSMIAAGSEREAKGILASIQNGEITFEDAAKTRSIGGYTDRSGDMGPKMAFDLIQDIPDASVRESAMALGMGDYSEVMRIASGESTVQWVFFRAEDAAQEADTSDSATMGRIRYYMRNFEGGRMEDWAIAQAQRFIEDANTTSFAEAMSAGGIQSRSFGPIPINVGSIPLFSTIESQGVSELALAGNNELFWETAFGTALNTPSEPIVQGNNVLVLFPTAETEVEESKIQDMAALYPQWIQYLTENTLQQHFARSPRLRDNFNETFRRYLWNPDEQFSINDFNGLF